MECVYQCFYNKNKFTELYNGIDQYVDSNVNMYAVGHDVANFYMVRYAGVNPANGDALWYTKDGEITNVFSEEDRVLIEGKSFIAPWQEVSEQPFHGRVWCFLHSSAGWPTVGLITMTVYGRK